MKKHIISFTRLKTFTGFNVITTFLTLTILSNLFISSNTQAASYTTSVSTSGALHLNVSSNGNGANLTTDNLNIISTCPAGYTVSISARSTSNSSFSDTTLYKDGDKTNTADTKKISPSTGTIDSPVSILDSNKKTWGYTTETNATTNSNSFVGLTSTQTNIFTSNTGTTATGTSLPIHYGVSIDNTIEPGIYKMSDNAVISYFLTASLDCTTYQVAFNPTSTAGGTTLSGTGTMQNQRIAEGTATNLASNTFTAPIVSGTQYYFAGWNTAQDGTGTSYTNGQSVTDLTTAGNTITLYAQWTDCPGGNICYSANVANASGVTGGMGNESVSNTATSTTLWASNFKRDGYGFAGWNTKADGTGTNYGPNQTITITAGQYSAGGLKLYANWIASAGNLQNWTCPDNTTMPIGTVTALTDNRDNNTYAIAKLADGKCWMIENLRLADKDESNNDIELSSTNTHNPSLPLNNSWYYKNRQGTLSTSNHLSATSDPTSTDPDTAWCQTNSSDCDDQSMLATNNTANFTTNTSSTQSSNIYSYGNYYNWYSATAGHGKYENGSGYVASGDICPAGWHLPTGKDASGDFGVLDVAMGGTGAYQSGNAGTTQSAKWRSYPNNFVYSGSANGPSVYNRGSNGLYWSSSANDSNYAYGLGFGSSGIYPGTGNSSKYDGRVVRCVSGV